MPPIPNLAGVLDLRQRPADIRSVLAKFSRVLGIEGVQYQERSWQDERFGAVNLLNGIADNMDQPAVSADGNLVLFLDGEVYNRAELRAKLAGTPGGRPETAAGLCLALLEHFGESFASMLNGQFNVVVYDRRARTVRVFNDRLGYRPFYFLGSGGLFLFALEQKAILAAHEAAAEPDPMGVLQLFTFGHHLEDRTFFRGIRAMPQGSGLRFGPEGCRAEPYWRPAYRCADRRLGLAECAEELGRRLVRATALRAPPGRRQAIFLSGGLDSRAAAGALARTGQDVTAFTFGDVELWHAREVARRLGFRHRALVYPQDCYHNALPRVVWRTECAIPFHGCMSVEQHRHIRGDADALFTGHLGDVLLGEDLMPPQFLMRRREQFVQYLIDGRSYTAYMPLPQLRLLFRKEFLARAYPEMVATLRRTVLSLEEERIPLLMNLWGYTQRQRRYTFSSPAVDRYLLEVISPFVDNDVIDWALGLPIRYLVARRAYTRMVCDTFPEVAAVPLIGTGRPVSAGRVRDVVRLGGAYAWKALRRLWAAPGNAVGSSTGAGLDDPRLRERLDRYLASDAFLAEAFDRDLIRDLLESPFAGRQRHVYAVAMLLTVAEGSRLFTREWVGAPPEEVRPQLAGAA